MLFHKLLYFGIYVRRFFTAGRNCGKLVSGGVFGRSRGIQKSIPDWSGGAPEAAKIVQKSVREGKKRPRASKRHLGAILEPKSEAGNFFWRGFWRPWGGLWGALGRLGGAFLGDLVAHRFFIDFLSIFTRFWDGFWYQNSKKKVQKTLRKRS